MAYHDDNNFWRKNIMNLLTFLQEQQHAILLDGAMGTQLATRGLSMGGHNCVTNPDDVLAIHKEYVGAGCQLLITNTLTMNRISLETHDMGVDVREVNLAGAKLAREAAGSQHYVLGDISSTGKLLKPYGELDEADAYKTFKEQASILTEGGVDGLIVETMTDMNEALCALKACKEVSDLPVIVSVSFSTPKKGGRTMMGNSAEDCAKAFTEAGAAAIGTNCGDLDPLEMAEVVAALCQATTLPVAAQPNAGKPRLVGEQTVFDMTPEDFAKGVSKCIQAGARLVGGCCGTSPAHIHAVAEVLGVTPE
jgi:methionine synthase I (cobalamin-dependent)